MTRLLNWVSYRYRLVKWFISAPTYDENARQAWKNATYIWSNSKPRQ